MNPDHLEPVTRSENLRRATWPNSQKTHCRHGHEYTDENTYHWRGHRVCRACQKGKRTEMEIAAAFTPPDPFSRKV